MLLSSHPSKNAPISRRGFVKAAAALSVLAAWRPAFAREAVAGERTAAANGFPYRVLYGNDTTHIVACTSPYHKRGEGFRPEMLEASVDEVSGLVDAHFLQPGVGWVPWWKSKVYPAQEHYRWFEERYGVPPDTWGQYMLGGGDLVELFVRRCRLRGQAPFISFRLNDAHYKEYVNAKKGDPISIYSAQGISRFYAENPQWRLGDSLTDWMQFGMDWAVPEVRAHKLSLIAELCENYDIEGLELDYMRYFSYFRRDRTDSVERRRIMTEFVAQVRALLDRTARGKHRWLAARVPAVAAAHDGMGIDLPAMVEAGLEVVTLSTSYFTAQQTDLPALRRAVPRAAVFNEMTHVVAVGKTVKLPGANQGDFYDARRDRRATPQLLATAAHLAYANGADGMSLFNFPYYREYGVPYQGPFSEPPFYVMGLLGDRARLAQMVPQHYILTPGWRGPDFKQPLPRACRPGAPETFRLQLAAPSSGWRDTGRLRIQGETALGDAAWAVRLNGRELAPTPDVSEPYPNFYTQLLGAPEDLRAWQVPADIPVTGENVLEITLQGGSAPRVAFIDLWLS